MSRGMHGRSPAILLLVASALAVLLHASVANAAAPPSSGVRAAQGRPAPSQTARPRALTAQELSQRGLLGRFKDWDPVALNLAWRPGRDAGTCDTAWTLAKVTENGIPLLTSYLVRVETEPGASPRFLLGQEQAIFRALVSRGRYEEADQFVRARLKVRVQQHDGAEAAERREALWSRLADLYAPTRPAEAERILNGLVADREALAAKTFAEFRGQPKDGRAWAYGKAWYDFRVLSARYALLRRYYVSAGRLEEAVAIVQEMATFLTANSALLTSAGSGYSQINGSAALPGEIARLRAQIALRAGRPAEAQAISPDCCGASPDLARLLLRDGRREEARIVLSRRMLDVSEEVEQVFNCLRVPAQAPTEQAIAAARRKGEDAAIGSPSWLFNNAVAHKQLDTLVDAGDALGHAVELGDLLSDAGLYDDAASVLGPATGLSEIALGPSHPVTLRALAAIARQERLHGEPAAAVTRWATWLDRSGAFLRDQLWRVSEDDRRRFFRDDRRNVDFYLAALREANPADAGARVLALSLRHKGLLASVAGETGSRARARGDAKSAATLAQLAGLRTQFASLALHNHAGTPDAALIRRQMGELEAQLAISLAPAAGGASAPTATPDAIVAALQPGEALVDFLVFADPDAGQGGRRERMVAVVARAGSAPTVVWWADVAPVRAAAARFRAAILTQGDGAGREREIAAAGVALNDVLWKPLIAPLGSATHVLLGPDDILNVVPLAALPDATGRPLVARYQVSMLSGLRDLLARAPAGRGSPALVMGSPTFGALPAGSGARGGSRVLGLSIDQISFSPLPGTLEESRKVSAMLVGSKLLDGDAATKAAVTTARSPSILHLATHGFFLTGLAGSPEEGDPLVSLSRSGVAFANANVGIRAASPSGDTQGILTALEATSLDLRDTRLVVLSACETGLGQFASGEGVYGLAQSLHVAGAGAVLATLWPVSDEATAVFMQRFYARLIAGDAPQVALRTVQRSFLAEPEFRDPVLWAPFVLTGR